MLKSRVLIGLFLVLSTVSTTHAVVAPDGPAGLPDLDARVDRGARQAAAVALRRGVDPTLLVAGPVAEPGQLRLAAVTRLEQRLGTRLSVRWDPVTGSPRLLSARRGFLSDADPRPAPVIAREQAVALAPLWNLSSEQAEALTVRRVVPLGGGGAMVWLEQEIAGLPVFHGHLGIGVDDEGRVVLVSGAGVTGAGALASPTPVHGPAEALVGLARAAGVALKSVPQPVAATADATAFRLPEFGNEVTVRQVVIPTAWGPKLGWRTDLHLLDRPAWHEVIVDDRLLQPVHRTNRTKHVDTRGRVFSNHPGVSSHELVSFPDDTDFRVLASPEGWTSSDVTEGNNTVVRDDRAGDDEATLGAQASATPPPPYLAFDFAFTDDPDADLDAAMTNLFYGINVSHDHFHELGFDEASGNFQVDNFGQGGIASDPVLGDAQDGSGTNNANFQTQPDGFMSRMQMFVWDTTGPLLDSSYDLGVIIHEYTHGVSTRLVGGADEVGCLNAWHGGAMGEGWSDFFASSFLEDPVIGAYLSGNDATGIRMFALDDNPASGKDFRDFCTYPNDFAPVFCAVHDNGEIWSGFLWTLRDAFIATYGAEVGVPLVERLVVDGMKFTPCGPTMVDARDGLILADRATNDGIHECLIKTAARQRWLGFSASAAGGGDAEPIADDGAWPECDGNGVVRFTRDGLEAGAATALYSCDDVVTIQVVDGTASGPLTVTLRTDGGDVEDLTLTSSADPAVFVGSLPSRREAVTAGDAVLQVVSGEGLTVEYVDMEAGMVTDTAQVDCVPRLALAGHRIENGACDADALPDWPQLPGLLDRNESADLRIVLANNMPKAVRGEVRVASMTPALLELLPALSGVPIEMGPALGGVPSQAVVTVKAAATSVPVPFDMGQVEITVLAEGFDPWVDVLELMLDLDYEVVPGVPLADDVDDELGVPVGPNWGTGTTVAGGNEWILTACDPPGNQAYRNGPGDCTGEYGDDQGNPYLTAPVLDIMGPDSAAARVTNVAWNHQVDLGSAGFPLGGIPDVLDADIVGVLLSDDPASIDTSDPFALLNGVIAFYADLEPLGIESNTMGWEPEAFPVDPGASIGFDFTQPVWLTWIMALDVSPSFPGIDAQGEGYWVDDLVIEHERVDHVPSAASCLRDVVVFSIPRQQGEACLGDPIVLDASASESLGCVGALEYRFLLDGAPVACFEADGMTPRTQDGDGWGTSPTCSDTPSQGTSYDVEVRCDTGGLSDVRSIFVAPIDGRPVGGPLGTLRVTKTGDCPGGDVELSWVDSGITPQTFVVTRADSPLRPLDTLIDVDGLTHVEAGGACDRGVTPYRGVLIDFYTIEARDACTGAPVGP